jgi:mannose-6-phosphate isomerase-like protein (cupin superfamily)
MSKYAIKNFKDVEDVGVNFGLEGKMEGRFTRKYLDSEELGVSYFAFAPGFRSESGHRHREQEEAYAVIRGSGRIRIDDEILDLKQWDVVRVAPEAARGFEGGPDGLEVIAIGGTKPEGGDGEMVADWWTG